MERIKHRIQIAIILILTPVWLILPQAVAVAATYYVDATNGDDSNPGTYDKPFKTIQAGVDTAIQGDTVCVRTGMYHEMVWISKSGITLANQLGHNPVIDGQYSLPVGWGELVRIAGDNNVFSGFEVKNSTWVNVGITGSNNHIRDLNSHHAKDSGILVYSTGEHNLVENCKVWYNAADNEWGNRTRPYWSGGLSVGRAPRYTTIRNNSVYNNWGEGVMAFETNQTAGEGNTIIEDNVIYDNWAVNLYNCNSHDTIIRRNVVYRTEEGYNKGFNGSGANIAYCDEQYIPGPTQGRSYNVTIINNMVVGGSYGFTFWLQSPVNDGGLRNVIIAYNTFANINNSLSRNVFWIQDGGIHENSRIENNIFLQEDSQPIAYLAKDDPRLQFSNNLWSKIPPASVCGTDDVIGDPRLTKSGLIAPGQLTPEWFKILADSPARNRAKLIAEVDEDFFGNPRGLKPDIGAYEYGAGPVADAGLDQAVTDENNDGKEEVTLDGSGSTDSDGNIVSYIWSEGGLQIAAGIKPTVNLSTGTHSIILTVTDDEGLTDTDTVTIKVLREDKEFGELPMGCYSNVINPSIGEKVLIIVELPKQAHVTLNLYDTKGNRIRELADEEKEPGTHKYYWDGKDDSGNVVGSGLYFTHILAGDYRKTKKIVVLK